MYFIVHCVDKPGSGELRAANRAAHIDYLKSLAHRVKVGGPTLGLDGETPNGSLLIVEAQDRAAVEALAADDPYIKAGLFERVTITPWKWVVGKP